MRRLAGTVLSSLRTSFPASVGRVQKAQAAGFRLVAPQGVSDSPSAVKATTLFFKSLALYTTCDTVALAASLPPVGLAFITGALLLPEAKRRLAHAVLHGGAPARSFLGPLALRVLSQKQQLPARFGVPVRIAAYCASCALTGPLLGYDMASVALAKGYAAPESPTEVVPITGRLRPTVDAVTWVEIFVRRILGEPLEEIEVYSGTTEGAGGEEAPAGNPLATQAEALRDQLLEAATALILERQDDPTVLHKHLAHFHGFIRKPPVKVLAPWSSSGRSPKAEASEPQGALALAVAGCLAPIILRHEREARPSTFVLGPDLWSITAMCLRAWVDRGLLPAAWSSWGFMAFILINCLPGLLGLEPSIRPDSPMSRLLRKVLPAGSVPAPRLKDWEAFHESVGRSRQLDDIQSMEKDRVTLLLLARAGFNPRIAISKYDTARVEELLADPAALQAAEAVVVPPYYDSDKGYLLDSETMHLRHDALDHKKDANLARSLQEALELHAKYHPQPTWSGN